MSVFYDSVQGLLRHYNFNITQQVSCDRLFFVRFEGNSILPKKPQLDFSLETRFSPMKLDFPAFLCKFYVTKFNLNEKNAWGDPFYGIFI